MAAADWLGWTMRDRRSVNSKSRELRALVSPESPSPLMDKLSSFTRFKSSCPYLGRTKNSTLRSLSTSTSSRFPSLSVLTERATKCPVMGPALNTRSKEIVAGYASVAANADVEKIHKEQGVRFHAAGASIEKCPHASAARAAARMADELAAATTAKKNAEKKAAAAGCPFHQKAPTESTKAKKPVGFDYEAFYKGELDKKHQDKSYRYFNNINRLARKFPVAHTANPKDEVEVWCANDYLGMGNNPVVLETIQCVASKIHLLPQAHFHLQSYLGQVWSWGGRYPKYSRQWCDAPGAGARSCGFTS